MTALRIGFIPLTDAAVVIAAARLGFAERQGLTIELQRENSWANIRDKLAFGALDAAHTLAPMALAIGIGAGQVKRALSVPFALNLNGNAVTVSRGLLDEMANTGDLPTNAASAAAALGRVAKARTARGAERLSFAMVHAFSSHHYQLRLLLDAAGLEAERDVRIVVIPPVYMVDALANGMIDGFCVGSPWNSAAVGQGVGHILVLGSEIARRCPEKVLALPRDRVDAEPELSDALVRALGASADWCTDPANAGALADLLAEPAHLALDAGLIRGTLEGHLPGMSAERGGPDYLLLGGPGINRPDPVHAAWLFDQITACGQLSGASATKADATAIYRPDLYDRILGAGKSASASKSDPIGLLLA